MRAHQRRMTGIAPMMQTEKNGAILVQNLSESRIPGMITGGIQQRLIPFGTDLHIRNADNWPRSLHSAVFIGLQRYKISHAGGSERGLQWRCFHRKNRGIKSTIGAASSSN